MTFTINSKSLSRPGWTGTLRREGQSGGQIIGTFRWLQTRLKSHRAVMGADLSLERLHHQRSAPLTPQWVSVRAARLSLPEQLLSKRRHGDPLSGYYEHTKRHTSQASEPGFSSFFPLSISPLSVPCPQNFISRTDTLCTCPGTVAFGGPQTTVISKIFV